MMPPVNPSVPEDSDGQPLPFAYNALRPAAGKRASFSTISGGP